MPSAPRGRAQCLGAMIVAQRLNDSPEHSIFGITTDGRGWGFGKLTEKTFVQDVRPFSLQYLDRVAGVLHFIVTECRDLVSRQPAET